MIDLRDLQPSDEEQLYRWRQEPEVDRWMSDAAVPDEAAHRRWYESLLSDPDGRGWMITRDGAPAGLMTLTGLTSHHRRASWNWFVGDAESRGRGVGRAAQVLGLDKAFCELGLDKVWAEVMADNDGALKLQTAAGFVREGYLRDHVLKAGRRRDVVLLGILAADWQSRREKARAALVEARLIAA
ncbi:MAG TPA: UDP-4-amino-4,6-dideoxy-N-acetyl-beta-L-altrosamine N-acetyltransferase [Caulobacter sp.]|nr:UDP-4-amino-4,6-dideoxy-N-acetyl-beta-L-altrosamine N-acetyltransferase [Caulobacter sp.]